jgi:hypothetical protein
VILPVSAAEIVTDAGVMLPMLPLAVVGKA